jgi:hypothetical protein
MKTKKIKLKDITVEFLIKIKTPYTPEPHTIIGYPKKGKFYSYSIYTKLGKLKFYEVDILDIQRAVWERCIKELRWW